MGYNSKYKSSEIEELLDQMSAGQSSIFLWNWNMANSGQLGDGEFNKLKESSIVLIGAGASDANYYVPMVRSADDDSIVLSVHTASSEGLGNLVFSFNANGSWTMETEELAFVTEDQLDGKQNAITDLDAIRSGAEKGATALQSVPSEYVTESELTNKGYATTSALNDKVDKVSGKQLSTEDFTTALKTKLEGLSNYDDTELSEALSTLRGDFDKLVSGDTTTAIKTFNEVIAFLDGIQDSQDLSSIIASIEQQIAGKMDKVTLATVATSGSYNDLSNKPTIPAEQVNADWNATSGKAQILNKPTIPTAVTESTVSGWGFTKNTGTYSKPSGGIPKSDLASAVQTSLDKADSAVIAKILGGYRFAENTDGMVSRGQVVYALPDSVNDYTSEDDIIATANTLKTINGQSLVGSGDIEISGGSGGGEDIRFFTDFTVEDFIKACEIANVVTYDTTELFNAMKSNKVICVPYRGFDKGFIVASYRSGENEEYPSMYIQKGDVEYYAWTGDDHALVGDYPIYNSVQVVEMAGGEEVVFECLSNHIYRITDPVDSLMPIPNYVVKGATIQFISGNSGTTLELYEALWANGEIPQIEPNTHYELSLMTNSTYEYNAVLTPFKPVE